MIRSCSMVVLLLVVSTAFAQLPRKISFQGVLTDTVGNPRPDGAYSLTFRHIRRFHRQPSYVDRGAYSIGEAGSPLGFAW